MALYNVLSRLQLEQELLVDRNPASPLPDWQHLPGVGAEAMAIQVLRVDDYGLGRNIIAFSHVGVVTGPDYFPLILSGTRAEIPAETFVIYRREVIIGKPYQPNAPDSYLLLPQVWLAPQFNRALVRLYVGSF